MAERDVPLVVGIEPQAAELWDRFTNQQFGQPLTDEKQQVVINLSIAVSLRRIADALQKANEPPQTLHVHGSSIKDWITARVESELQTLLSKEVAKLDLSVRTHQCLRNDDLVYIGDITQKTETELLRIPNFGRKSLCEINAVLLSMGLSLGMYVSGWKRP